jgi:hypothetical protein
MTKQQVIVLANELIIIICIIISMICLMYLLGNIESNSFTYISSLGKNWSIGPIIHTETDLVCNGNENYVPMVDDKWAGTNPACYKLGSLALKCGKNSKKYSPIEARPYNIWHGALICAKRIKSNYLNLNIVRRQEECRGSSKSCGVIDSFGNFLCVDASSPCPYNSLEVFPSNSTLPTDYNYTKIPVVGADMLFAYKENKQKATSLNQFVVDEDSPCVNPYYKNYKSKIFLTEVYANNRDNCLPTAEGILYDPRVEEKDSYGFWELYKDNGIIDLMNIYPGFTEYSVNNLNSRTLKLFQKSYIGIDTRCLQTIKENDLSAPLLEDLINYETKMSGWFGTILTAVGFCILTLSFFCVNIYHLGIKIFHETVEDGELQGRAILQGITVAVSLVYLIIAVIIRYKLGSAGLAFSFLFEKTCVDNISIDAINLALSANDYLKYLLNWIIYSTLFSYVAFSVNAALSYFIKTEYLQRFFGNMQDS